MRKELCRNFQRGSCRYGENCRFLHPQQVTQQANNKPNNPFGFGSQSNNNQQQQQQQKSLNPFGFGVQGGGSNGTSNQFQAFDNKWTRTPSTSSGGGGGVSAQQSGKQTQQSEHKCTDPAACKKIMQDDFKNERPIWKLSCYGHWKHLPCDISGDISYEELRLIAYEEAKRGVPLHSIVARERNLHENKMREFEAFLQNPYKGSVTVNQNPFPATTPSIFPPANLTNSPPAFSAFNQQPVLPNTNTVPPNPFARFNQQPNAFSVNTPQPVPSGPPGFQSNPPVIFKPASFGPGPGLFTTLQNNNIFPSVTPTPAPNAFQNNNTFPSVTPTPAPNTFQNNQNAFNFNVPVAPFTTPVIPTTNTSPGTELQTDVASVDTSVWLKEKWNPGEIPEQAPPDAFV
ncbi:hypothetical protein AALP_AA2G195300 [Arabis alpina]|uniref:C3H1-type domain-containing protein n=1 Tax=Arabis alpina TaxID=50452 RepID=A0A087HIL7_ARAAL|nr:hypothetical protein AALP_AA2G195300 [Arabis alpina]